jgi:quinoprotein glucose dehydrogenase
MRQKYIIVASCSIAMVLAQAGETYAAPLRGRAPQAIQDRYVPDPPGVSVDTWVTGLSIPWSLVFLPDGRALVSERGGRIRLIEANGHLTGKTYATLNVSAHGEGGLMGLALHPGFPKSPYVYAMLTRLQHGSTENAVIRLKHEGDRGEFDRDIVNGIPAGTFHDGGRIAFGPDGMLYIGTGDATVPALAQDLHSLAGKILRVTADGTIPADNPFPGLPVYSYGHRNVQGLAWHPQSGALFASEHGPTGEFNLHARDEINLIKPAGNYGWPEATCAVGQPKFTDPLICWPDASVPPGGSAFAGDDLLVATLKSEALIRIRFAGSNGHYRATDIQRWFISQRSASRYGRLRDVVRGPEGSFYLLTSNRDGRGRARPGDDRILRVTLTGQALLSR